MTECERHNNGTTCEGAGHMTDAIHTITLHDYHPGEYTNFDDWARELRIQGLLIPQPAQADPNAKPLRAYGPIVVLDDSDERWADAEGAAHEDDGARWTLTGSSGQLRALYHRLLMSLATPAWDWYGMGGDDNCYDYWPNTMILAADFRDKLMLLALSEDPNLTSWETRPYHTTYLYDDLARVYLLCRARYVADSGAEATPPPLPLMHGVPAQAEALDYFNEAILSPADFISSYSGNNTERA